MTENSVGGAHRLVIHEDGRRTGHGFAMTAFSGVLPPEAAGRWCRVMLVAAQVGLCWAKLELTDSVRGQVVREAFFPQRRLGRRKRYTLLVHVPLASGRFTLSVFVPRASTCEAPVVCLLALGRIEASVRLFAGGWRSLAGAFQGNPLGLLGRVRAMLGQSAARRGQAPPYAAWIDLYDRWGERERHALLASPATATIAVWVVAGGDDIPLTATLQSVAAQWHPADALCVLRTIADWHVPTSQWVVMLCAGETLVPHALACLAKVVREDPSVLGVCADIDRYGPGEVRISAGLRPPPDAWLMRSPIFAAGAWMFHRSAIDPGFAAAPLHAGADRLAVARSLPAARLMRVPLILTSCPIDAAPSSAVLPVVSSPRDKVWPRVSILVPSACRSRHVLACLRKIACATDYPNFEILVAVSDCDPADRRQARIMRTLGTLPHVRIICLEMPHFNFAAVTNKAAVQSDGNLLLLLNDDVSPITSDWLRRLVAHTRGEGESRADIVGPRLLYGNGLVQHAGVIMGLANLCEHAFRLAHRSDEGPQGLARLNRQVSAVTAACMLVRRDMFEMLGGLDEGFAVALNDVDFCLRACDAGACIMLAADVDMYHFESLSLGRHYHGARAGLEAAEVHRLRDRWALRIVADPFYHPCASLELGREFHPGFPPRHTPLSWIGLELPAPH